MKQKPVSIFEEATIAVCLLVVVIIWMAFAFGNITLLP